MTGNAGPRIAAGQLGYANPDTEIDVGAKLDLEDEDSSMNATSSTSSATAVSTMAAMTSLVMSFAAIIM